MLGTIGGASLSPRHPFYTGIQRARQTGSLALELSTWLEKLPSDPNSDVEQVVLEGKHVFASFVLYLVVMGISLATLLLEKLTAIKLSRLATHSGQASEAVDHSD